MLVALLLNRVRLAPGEALFLPAGNIHAYLHGTAIEVMASSDNVLRAGLTPKHVDAAELMRITDFTPRPIPVVVPEYAGPIAVYRPGAAEFELAFVTLGADDDGWHELPVTGPRILLVLDGELEARVAERVDRLGPRARHAWRLVFVPAASRSALAARPRVSRRRRCAGGTACRLRSCPCTTAGPCDPSPARSRHEVAEAGPVPATVPGIGAHRPAGGRPASRTRTSTTTSGCSRGSGCSDWRYETTFEWTPGDSDRVELVFDGLDTVATVDLNGDVVGTHGEHAPHLPVRRRGRCCRKAPTRWR